MDIRSKINFKENQFLMFVLDDLANYMEYEKGKKVIRMTLGKSELPLHKDIIEAMNDSIEDFKKSSLVYPGGLPLLKKELSKHYKEYYDVDIDAKNFIISPGTSAAFRNLFAILSAPGDEVLIPKPYYSLYHFSALLTGASIRYYNIDTNTKKLDMDSFKKNFTDKTKIVVINTPGNPLGNILTDEDLYEMDSFVDGRAVIINDEIYSNFYFDQKNKSVMNLKDTKSVFITTNAFSKAYRMYSRRVGYCIVPDELIEPLTVIQHHTLLTVDPIVQFGAIAALGKQKEVEELLSIYKERRDYTMKVLSGNQYMKPIYSEGGFYITLDCKEYMEKYHYKTSLDLAVKILEEKSVAVVPGSDFGLPHTLRLSFSSQYYNEGIDLLKEFFDKGVMYGE